MLKRRKYTRAKVDLKVSYNDGSYTNVTAKVCDISKGGMYVQDAYAPEMQEIFAACIDADDLGEVIQVEGLVVRKTSTGIGVMFTHTDKQGLDNLLISISNHF